jgi:hypothetical protein
MGKVANVALSDTFDTWRVRSNQSFTNLFEINPTANVVSANSITVGSNTSITRANTFISTHTQFTGANTNIRGGTLLVTSNTNINGTLLVNGAAPGTDDNALAFAIALG